MPRPTRDLKGMRFGKLTVLEFSGYKKGKYHSKAYWKCRCDCGNEKEIAAAQLLSGSTNSCGCLHGEGKEKDNIIGNKYNRLTAIKRIYDGRNGVRYLFKCDCGKEKVILKNAVVSGKTKSCGCLSDEKIRERCFKDLSGKKFGRLTALDYFRKGNRIYWNCICECGNISKVQSSKLLSGAIISCGCYKEEHSKDIGEVNKTHSKSNTRLYKIYQQMIARCYKEYSSKYSTYGARGINVCDEWLGENGFVNFYNWAMDNGYRDNLTIDRKDNNGNYCPQNCRWATAKEQANNTRSTVFLTYRGETKSASEWAEITGIRQGTLTRRKRDGWTDEQCIETKVGEKRK